MVDAHERAFRSAICDPDAVQLVFETTSIVEHLTVYGVVCVARIEYRFGAVVDLDGVFTALAADDTEQIDAVANEL